MSKHHDRVLCKPVLWTCKECKETKPKEEFASVFVDPTYICFVCEKRLYKAWEEAQELREHKERWLEETGEDVPLEIRCPTCLNYSCDCSARAQGDYNWQRRQS